MLPLDEDFVRVADKLKRAYNRQEFNLEPLLPTAPAKPTIAAGHGQVPSSATNPVSPPLPNPKKTK